MAVGQFFCGTAEALLAMEAVLRPEKGGQKSLRCGMPSGQKLNGKSRELGASVQIRRRKRQILNINSQIADTFRARPIEYRANAIVESERLGWQRPLVC